MKEKKINNSILSIDYDDDNENYEAFKEHLNEHTIRQKQVIYNQIDVMGDVFIKEIDRKKKNNYLKKTKIIPYILKHSKNKYDADELLSYEFEDVLLIYNEIKEKRKPLIVKLFNVLYGRA